MQFNHLVVVLLICILLVICHFSPKTLIDTFEGTLPANYTPIILRPRNSVTAEPTDSDCTWPCYSDRKYQQWCSESNAINYYGMRPVMQPDDYHKLLSNMFKKLIFFNNVHTVPTEYEYVNCTDYKESLMEWIMKKINHYVSITPEMHKNGPWKTEQFYYTDVDLYKSENYFKIVFNLYNTLRSTSTLVYAIIYNKHPIIEVIDFNFVNNVDHSNKINGIADYKNEHPDVIEWNYMNTLPVQKFDRTGQYSNNYKDNIVIEGGIPESLREKIRNCKEETIPCIVPGFTGILAPSAKLATIDGTIKDVHLNPKLVYDRNIEKVEGVVYV